MGKETSVSPRYMLHQADEWQIQKENLHFLIPKPELFHIPFNVQLIYTFFREVFPDYPEWYLF